MQSPTVHKLETRVLGQSKELFASYLLCLNFLSIRFLRFICKINEIEVVKRCDEVSNVWKILSKEKRKKRSFSH